MKKYKVSGPLYRPNKVDILVSSPFSVTATFTIFLTDNEPTIPVNFEKINKPRFYLQRLNLIDQEITLTGMPKEGGQEIQEHKLYIQLICLSTQIGNSWIWFKSDVGQFFIKVTTQPRWDFAIDTLQAKVQTWPMDPCSCGEACECYRTTVLTIPHHNELMIKSLRYALFENASDVMMNIFDYLIGTVLFPFEYIRILQNFLYVVFSYRKYNWKNNIDHVIKRRGYKYVRNLAYIS